ncbi:MAG: endonuclease/exonuclease/phosphatase family protein [Rhodocyclaceae bacterium]|jgi:endonuclease/exonuclease/phosphatase family metal-dependent hydrolase|nr:endonuclease/exonuclease/phosphatase family protein [Rhodocyclaceae bacterium]
MRILSWNIQWGRGLDGRVDLVRIADEARDFDADVLCLQEVAVNHPALPGMPAGQLDQVAVLRGLFVGFEHAYGVGSDLPDGLGGRRQFGNLILSRQPILQIFRHLLPWPAEPEKPSMQRVAVEAVIEAAEFPGGALRVITTHLEYYSASQRAAQIGRLREICDEGWRHAVAPRSSAEPDSPFAVLPRGEGVVLCGDFNCAGGPAELEPLTKVGADGTAPRLIDAWMLAHPDQPHAPTVGVHEVSFSAGPQTYDYFFVSENIAGRVRDVEVDLGTRSSDHQPVVLTLDWGRLGF